MSGSAVTRPHGVRAWHARTAAEVMHDLAAHDTGLSTEEAAHRRARIGPNRLAATSGPSSARLLLEQLDTPLMMALGASAVVAMALGELEDGIVVLAVIVLNALIGFLQELRAGRAIAALGRLVAEPARVLRDGAWLDVPGDDLVPGDVVAVSAGERVAADLRLLHAEGLRAEESALTGESTPVEKQTEAAREGAALGDRRSMLYAGTIVAGGGGDGVVVATGADTELGHVAALLDAVDPLRTPLTRQLDRFGRIVTAAIAAMAASLVAVALLRGFALADAALAGISLAVAAVPEGLPAVVTIALAVGVRRMARRRAIIRHLPAVETLGGTTVVASDKTGTLTQNRMTVTDLWVASGRRGGAPATDDDAVHELLLAGVLCNDATPGAVTSSGAALGDPTETALLDAAQQRGLDLLAARSAWPRNDTLPFDARRQYMVTSHPRADGGVAAFVKGAPEAVLPRCTGPGVAAARNEVERLTSTGHRVLLFATADEAGHGPLDALHDLRLIGVQAMIDPPRPAAREAVSACHRAGVRVMMITGDHPRTARAIGAALGLGDRPAATGADIDRVDDAQLAEAARRHDVYARFAPEQKLRLVRALQRQGEVVAMTGDGVNDAPALRQADIGVAMGQGGTAAAKDAADMVLADDDFSTLRAAIEEGRRVYDNLVKALSFVLPTSLGQALIIAVAIVTFPAQGDRPLLPVEPVQILWINLIVAVALALPLAFEAPEPDLMHRPPRPPATPLLDRLLIVRTVLVSVTLTAVALVLFALEHAHQEAAGAPAALALARAQSTAVTGAVLLQALYLIGCRSLTRPNREIGWWSNPWVYVGIAVVLGLQALFLISPFMHEAFGSASLDLRQLTWAAAGALVVLPVTSLEERWRRRGEIRPPG